MLEELDRFYKSAGINSTDDIASFKCENLTICIGNGERNKFIVSREAFVGTEYEKGTAPRMLFLSSSPRGNPVSLVDIRREVESNDNSEELNQNSHWYQTLEFATHLLDNIVENETVTINNVARFIAHIPSCKCHFEGSHQDPDRLFTECRSYVEQEIIILSPDIIVTQGRKAEDVIKHDKSVFKVQEEKIINNKGSECIIKIVKYASKKNALWIPLIHPTAKGKNKTKYNENKKNCWHIYQEYIERFVNQR